MSLYSASHGDSVSIRGEDSGGVVRNLFYGDPDGSAHIYYNGTSVAHTDTYGLDVGSSWSSSHLIMGAYHLWVDSTGDLRIKNGAPSSDTDGTVVGVQS
jgi:hypothetical protein